MMRNVSPTHLKILHVQAANLADADALAESTFNEWSKDHPGVNIIQVDRHCVRDSVTTESVGEHSLTIVEAKPVFHVSIAVTYDLAHEADAITILMHDLDNVTGAWESWVKMVAQAQAEQKALTIVDMQIVLAQPLAKLHDSFVHFRKW